jgi:hypothetical protein
MKDLQQFEKILDTEYRIISMETYDVDRIHEMFTRLSRFTPRPIYEWEPGVGMRRLGASHIVIPRTQSARDVLMHIENTNHYAVYVMRNFNDAMKSEATVETLRRMATSEQARTIVLLGEAVDLPESLKPLTLRSRHQLRQAS